MLDKFRRNFPSSSLTSDLLQIRDGYCYVQCRIIDNSSNTILNAIACDRTVEDAEDAARDRVLQLFFAGEPVSITAKRPSDELLADFKEAIAVEPPTPITEEQPPKKRSPKKKEPEPVETVTETAIAEPEIIKPVLPEKEEISNAIAEPEPEPEPEPVKAPVLELTAPTPQLELIASPSFESIDFSDVIAKTTKHMARLNWTNEQGKNYLIATYNKKSRQLLTDEELLEFLQYLESQPDDPS